MKHEDLNPLFNINPNTITKINPHKAARWGNLDTSEINQTIFLRLQKYFPECQKLSPGLIKKTKMAIGLAFVKNNPTNFRWACPTFKDFVTCALMITSGFKGQTPGDEQWLVTLMRLALEDEIRLAS